MLMFKNKNNCTICNTNKKLHHFQVKKYRDNKWVVTNPQLILCDKCCSKLFGEGWNK